MIRISALAIALTALASGAQAQTSSIGTFHDWEAARTTLAGKEVCYAISTPKKTLPAGARRGDIAIVVSNRPSEKVRGEVMVMAGYPYRKGSQVTLTVDGKNFELFTEGENAWATDSAGDRQIATAMRAGATMVIKGTSGRGTNTTDTYSLKGISAALDAVDRTCPVK